MRISKRSAFYTGGRFDLEPRGGFIYAWSRVCVLALRQRGVSWVVFAGCSHQPPGSWFRVSVRPITVPGLMSGLRLHIHLELDAFLAVISQFNGRESLPKSMLFRRDERDGAFLLLELETAKPEDGEKLVLKLQQMHGVRSAVVQDW